MNIDRKMRLMIWGATIALILLAPILLLLSPVIVPVWILWSWARGHCLRCGHAWTCYSAMPLLAEDGGGSLHRCRGCGAYYYLPIMGPADVQPMTAEEVQSRYRL